MNEADILRSIPVPPSTVKDHLYALESAGALYSRKGSYIRTFFLPHEFAESQSEKNR
jgi:hypothetical protein